MHWSHDGRPRRLPRTLAMVGPPDAGAMPPPVDRAPGPSQPPPPAPGQAGGGRRPPRTPLLIGGAIAVAVLLLCCAGGAGGALVLRAQANARATETAVAQANATGTAAARATGTAVAQATGTAVAQVNATGTAVAQATGTAVAQATATAEARARLAANQTATANANATATAAAPTATPPPRPTPRPTPTTRPATATVVTTARSEANFSAWTEGTSTSGSVRRAYAAADREYRVALLRDGVSAWSSAPNVRTDRNFTLEVTARRVAGPDEAIYGAIFHLEEQPGGERSAGYYAFYVIPDGRYALARIKDDGDLDLIQPPTRAAAVKGGNEPNTLTVTCRGDQATLAINGETLGTHTIEPVDSGRVGIFAAAPRGATGVEIGYSKLVLTPDPR